MFDSDRHIGPRTLAGVAVETDRDGRRRGSSLDLNEHTRGLRVHDAEAHRLHTRRRRARVPSAAGGAPVASRSMRRSLPLATATLLLAVAGCGGGDDPANAIVLPVASEECEDLPDPADYIEGQVPPAIRPCSIPSELAVHTVRSGSGLRAASGDRMIIDYTGLRAEDGVIFDTSYSRGAPLNFALGRGAVIKGWDDGLVGAQAGSVLKLDIPNELAYGDSPPFDVLQPSDALSFVIEVRAVIGSFTAADAPLDLQIEPSIGALEVSTNDIITGDGDAVELGDTAVVLMLLVRGDNEIVLFNSWERGDPIEIVMEEGTALQGIFEGLQGATVGTLRAITVPPEQGFGPDGETRLGLPADTDLIVIVEVIGVY